MSVFTNHQDAPRYTSSQQLVSFVLIIRRWARRESLSSAKWKKGRMPGWHGRHAGEGALRLFPLDWKKTVATKYTISVTLIAYNQMNRDKKRSKFNTVSSVLACESWAYVGGLLGTNLSGRKKEKSMYSHQHPCNFRVALISSYWAIHTTQTDNSAPTTCILLYLHSSSDSVC